MWRLCKLGYRHEPGLLAVCLLAGTAVGAARRAAGACGSSGWARARSRATGHSCGLRPIALGVSAAATWFLQTVSTRVQRRFRDKVTIALESHVATLLASIATIAHQERPDYLDRLAVLRNQVFMLDHMYMSLFTTCGWILRLGVTIALLVSIHPGARAAGGLCAAHGVHIDVAASRGARRLRTRRPGEPPRSPSVRHRRRPQPPGRKCASPVSAIGSSKERRLAWEFGNRFIAAARWRSAAWHTRPGRSSGPATSARSSSSSSGLGAPAGDVLLALAAGSRLSFYVGATVGEIGFLRGVWMDAAHAPGVARGLRGRARRRRPTCRHRHGWPTASASSTSRSRTRGLIVSCSTMWT